MLPPPGGSQAERQTKIATDDAQDYGDHQLF